MTPETPPEQATPGLVDEAARRRFEAGWRDGCPGPIEAFLPPLDDPRYLPTLEKLVLIELEFAWKAHAGQPTEATPPPRIERYVERFSALDRSDVLARLLEEEYAVRRRCGDEPSEREFRSRFPTQDLTLITPGPSLPSTTGEPAIPGYEILSLIGRGGMGVVYKARQLSLKRSVALKVIRAAAHAGPHELARFRTEAEAVARLQHPNIVQIFEVGEHDGCPYLVLEYVAGGSLADQLGGKPQPPLVAAALVETQARAVQHAHERGIVHRDLKPGNILLEPNATLPGTIGTPKVADFGLAKRLDADADQTQSGAVVGTPSYMAPEQAAGKPGTVGPLADVYALGAILYECLTGRPPFNGATVADTLDLVRNIEPVVPRRLQPRVPRDLETICLKCLEKEPARRYGGADALAADLGRFLRGEPIHARPASLWRRAAKWGRRRPALAGLLLVSALAVSALVAGGLWHHARLGAALERAEAERERARANYRTAREAVETMLTRVSEERLAYVPQMEHARREILQDALRFYRRFLDENGADTEARHDAALALGRVAFIDELLGRHAEAEQAFGEALALLTRLMAEFPDQPGFPLDLAEQHNRLALLYQKTGRFTQAEAHFRAALTLAEARAARLAAAVRNNLAVLLEAVGDFEAAETAYRSALAAYDKLHAAAPTERPHRRDMGLIHNNLALVLQATGRVEEAAKHVERALALQEALVREAPQHPAYRSELASTDLTRGCVLEATGKLAAARDAVRRAAARFRALVRDFPGVPAYRRDLVRTLVNLGMLSQRERDRRPARAAFAEAVALGRQLVAECPDVPEVARDLAAAWVDAGMLERTERHREKAAAAFREARTLLQPLTAGPRALPDHRHSLGLCDLQTARLHADAGEVAAAERVAKQAIATLGKLVEELPHVPAYRGDLADAWDDLALLLQRGKRFPEAADALRTALDQRRRLANAFPRVPAYRQRVARVHANLAAMLEAQGALKEAEREILRAVALQEQLVKAVPAEPAYRQELARSLYRHGGLLSRQPSLNVQKTAYTRALALQEQLVLDYPDEPAYRWELAATMHRLNQLFLKANVGPEMAYALARRAVEHQRRGLRLDVRAVAQRRVLRDYTWWLAATLAQQGRHTELAEVALGLWVLYPDQAAEYAVAAAYLASCVRFAQGDRRLAAAARAEAMDRYGAWAVRLLRVAVARGHRQPGGLRGSASFAALRGREDFKALLREVEP